MVGWPFLENAVRTFVAPFDPLIVREALEVVRRALDGGGDVAAMLGPGSSWIVFTRVAGMPAVRQ